MEPSSHSADLQHSLRVDSFDSSDPSSSADILTLEQAAHACSVTRLTILRYLDERRFEHAFRGADGVWRVPVADLVEAGLRPDGLGRRPAATRGELIKTVERLRAENLVLREMVSAGTAVARGREEKRERPVEDLRFALRMLPEDWARKLEAQASDPDLRRENGGLERPNRDLERERDRLERENQELAELVSRWWLPRAGG